MTMEGFRVPDEKSLREYIKATPSLASKLGNEVDNLKIKEVGDGNLNFVYIVISPSGSTVVKQKESCKLFKKYGRPTILHFARGLGDCYKQLNGGQGPEIYLKREVENPTGSFKMNNVVAQILLAKKLGKTCIDAEFGSGATCYSSCGFMCTILAKMSYVTPLCDGELGVLHGSMTACCRQSKSLIPAWILEGLITRGWDRRSAIYKRSGG